MRESAFADLGIHYTGGEVELRSGRIALAQLSMAPDLANAFAMIKLTGAAGSCEGHH